MNSTCKEAYSIFCQYNKGSNNEKVSFVLNILNIHKKKTYISNPELNFLSHYMYFTIGKEKLSLYEMNLLIAGVSELTIPEGQPNRDLLDLVFYSITRCSLQ